MKNYIHPVLLTLLGIIVLSGCGGEENHDNFQESSEKEANVIFAEEFIMFLSEGRFERATEYFDETMKEELPQNELEHVWASLEEQFGSFQKQEYRSTKKVDNNYETVIIKGFFDNGEVTFQITLNQDEKIAGFYVK